jgi:hypothetical protein
MALEFVTGPAMRVIAGLARMLQDRFGNQTYFYDGLSCSMIAATFKMPLCGIWNDNMK